MNAHRIFALVLLCASCMLISFSASAYFQYPTIPASEETPPAVCATGYAISHAKCTGGYCDNTQFICRNTNHKVSDRVWSHNFPYRDSRGVLRRGYNCGSMQIMTGISCSESYCGKVSIECSTISESRKDCKWMGPYSEEQRDFIHFGGRYANGMWCAGKNCDNHYYHVCRY